MNNPYRTMADLLDDADIDNIDNCIPTDDEYTMSVQEAVRLAQTAATENDQSDNYSGLESNWDC